MWCHCVWPDWQEPVKQPEETVSIVIFQPAYSWDLANMVERVLPILTLNRITLVLWELQWLWIQDTH